MRTGIRSAVLAAACSAAWLGTAGAGPAAASEQPGSFDGSCSLEVTVFFSPPATNSQQSLSLRDVGHGTCDGTLNGREVSDIPMTFASTVEAVDGSCLRARTTVPGRGTMTFEDGTQIGFGFTFDFTGTEGEIELTGERSGSASGHGSFLTMRTPPDIALQCAGEGAKEAPLDIAFATDSPLVSARQPGKSSPRSRGGGKRLRLRVRPQSVDAGKQTTFAFRVTRANGRVVRGAVVRFAGRRVRSGRRGRARIVTDLAQGRWTARARRRGFRPGHAAVESHSPRDESGERTVTFSGDCEFAGYVTFTPPLTNNPQTIDQSVEGPGTCSGTLVDGQGRTRELEDEPATYLATGHGEEASCQRGDAEGGGALAFGPDGLDFKLSEKRAGGTVVASLTGASGGSATAFGMVSRNESPPSILERCAGPGLERVGLEGQLHAGEGFAG